MTNAVIVSTARTAARQELEGRLQHDPRRDARRPCRQGTRSSAPASTPARSTTCIMGCATPEGATGGNIARQIALRAGLPITTSGMTVNRFCSSRPADHRDGRAAHHRRRGRRLSSPAASRASRACRTRRTSTCCADPWLVEHKPRSTGRCCRPPSRSPSATTSRASAWTSTARASQQKARRGAGGRQVRGRDRADHRDRRRRRRGAWACAPRK